MSDHVHDLAGYSELLKYVSDRKHGKKLSRMSGQANEKVVNSEAEQQRSSEKQTMVSGGCERRRPPAGEKRASSRAAANSIRASARLPGQRAHGPIVASHTGRGKLESAASPPITSVLRLGHASAASSNGGKKKRKNPQTKQDKNGGSTESGMAAAFARNLGPFRVCSLLGRCRGWLYIRFLTFLR